MNPNPPQKENWEKINKAIEIALKAPLPSLAIHHLIDKIISMGPPAGEDEAGKEGRYWHYAEIENLITSTRQETIDKILEIAKKLKKRFRCATCDGAKCGHTLGCQVLSDLRNQIEKLR